MTIKYANETDLPIIKALAHEIWPEAYSKILSKEQLAYMLDNFYCLPSLTKQLNELHHYFIIGYLNESPAGFASYSCSSPNQYKLHKLYIKTSQQEKGIGKSLLTFIFSKIKTSEPITLQLNVNRHNPAIEFYKKLGFKIVAEEDIDIGNDYYMNDYVMEITL